MRKVRYRDMMLGLVFILLLCGLAISMATNRASASAGSEEKIITIDLSKRTGKIQHGASGGLYALSEPGIPAVSSLLPLKVSTIAQKAPFGLQHPGGDALRVAETFQKAGGRYIQVYLQDVYANWPYEKGRDADGDGIPDDYLEKLMAAVSEISQSPYRSLMAYVPFNEPDAIWYDNDLVRYGIPSSSKYLKAWRTVHEAIRSVDPLTPIVGPNLANYNSLFMNHFLVYCRDNDCLPDVVSWHELNTSFFSSWRSHYTDYRNIERRLGISPRPICINEYGTFSDLSVPGRLIQWISRFEESKADACLAYWHVAGNFDDLIVEGNCPTGAWWLYKWYADMSGETVMVEVPDPNGEGLSGLASVDESRSTIWVLVGGDDTDLRVRIDSIPGQIFGSAVNVKVYSTDWSGYEGALVRPTIVKEETCWIVDGQMEFSLNGLKKTAAYFAIISKTNNSAAGDIRQCWQARYEAEDAQLINCNVFTDGTEKAANNNVYSGGKGVYVKEDGGQIVFDDIVVPQSGTYLLEIYYSNGNRVNNSGVIARNYLRVDDGDPIEISFVPTANWRFVSKTRVFLFLTPGRHVLTIGKLDGGLDPHGVDIDRIDLSFISSAKTVEDLTPVRYEAEEAQLEGGVRLEYPGRCSGSAVVRGFLADQARARFTLSVSDNGYYDVTLVYATAPGGQTRARLTLNNTVNRDLVLQATDGEDEFGAVTLGVFLEKGINILDVSGCSGKDFRLDYIELSPTHDYDDCIIEVEAESENNALYGTAKTVVSTYASGGKYVGNVGFGEENALAVRLDDVKADDYSIVLFYSNGEIFGFHQYNINVVERFAVAEIDSTRRIDLYFRNTNGDEVFRTKVFYVRLDGGSHTIKFYNPNTEISLALPSPHAPNLDKVVIAPTFVL